MKIYGQHLIDENAINQFYDIVKDNPDVIDCALMPDAHCGQTVPIGSVILSKSFHPEWCGVDIGCGMLTICFTKKQGLKGVRQKIIDKVPLGFNHHKSPIGTFNLLHPIQNADHQLGTLGGGNHFIEIGTHDNFYYLTIHSGSRGVGFKTAQTNPSYAVFTNVVQWAAKNRLLIAKTILKIIQPDKIYDILESLHNFVTKYNGYYLHRKGATEATLNQKVIIPANMSKGVIIALGKTDKFPLSCSHGAGRLHSRKEAKKQCDITAYTEQMKGIECDLVPDENPNAYKNINEVMKEQNTLVQELFNITPVLNVKG